VIRVTGILSGPSQPGAPDDFVQLDHDLRHRRRLTLRSEGGIDFLLDLPEATTLRNGNVLVLDDGRSIGVKAAAEPLAEIKGARAGDAGELARIAWHLGNRHLPAAISADRILVRRDHVIEDMVRGLGARVRHVTEPFEPEGGAYGHGPGHGHNIGTPDHDHDHD
jgi:urease accessory protein